MPQSLGRFVGISTSSVSVAALVAGGIPLSAIEGAFIASADGRRIGVGLVNPLTFVDTERQARAPKIAAEKENFMVLLLLF